LEKIQNLPATAVLAAPPLGGNVIDFGKRVMRINQFLVAAQALQGQNMGRNDRLPSV
jgi:hypothetical protein